MLKQPRLRIPCNFAQTELDRHHYFHYSSDYADYICKTGKTVISLSGILGSCLVCPHRRAIQENLQTLSRLFADWRQGNIAVYNMFFIYYISVSQQVLFFFITNTCHFLKKKSFVMNVLGRIGHFSP